MHNKHTMMNEECQVIALLNVSDCLRKLKKPMHKTTTSEGTNVEKVS